MMTSKKHFEINWPLKALESNKKIIEASSQEITFVDPKPATEDPIISEETNAFEENAEGQI